MSVAELQLDRESILVGSVMVVSSLCSRSSWWNDGERLSRFRLMSPCIVNAEHGYLKVISSMVACRCPKKRGSGCGGL